MILDQTFINAIYIVISFQLHCCGVESWKDYRSILGKNILPASCCDPAETSSSECEEFRSNPTEEIVDQHFYTTVSKTQ